MTGMEQAMKLATGVDLIEIERLESTIERYGERLLNRVYTIGEMS